MAAKSYTILPTAEKAGYYQKPRRPNYKKLAAGIALVIASIGLLYKPAISHYERIYQQSHSKTHSVEERARTILSTTPLIGKKMTICTYT